ncbi:uncharacterized protein PGTG_10828 [Puccinia graminis f. sp. tritici CRL 75-36-700-3]|uniref:Uncharacterized protein n=1 Tax=Puccinia graminis f. sp. tritici (strain CRL 75-36-700-3 / race SCCL) TaxID=418459 RepID=E3KK44_PUCGT|nr:uncharacterized protein PGTG_10828 [Puccinia graminis f. sp. tritici CRL 75-36-700-3]EFP84669.1 hypothetical protein PGTG_10828 [Puccinia graminis f. sp. tritici CRL 75-36-700-3]
MATVPQFERQDSVFKQTGAQPRHVDTSFGNWKQSQMESMKEDFLLIKEDLKNLLKGKLADGTFFNEDEESNLELKMDKFQAHVKELNTIYTSILRSIQLKLFQNELTKKEILQQKDAHQKDTHVSHDIPTSSKGKMNGPTFNKISRDEIEVIEGHIPRLLTNDLNKLLDKIPFELTDKVNTSDHETFIAIRLHSMIFQTINYLYKYNLIPKEDINNLFGSKQKLDLAATNMVLIFKINAEFGIRRPISFDGAYILRSHHSAHFRNMFKVLGDNQNRYIQ